MVMDPRDFDRWVVLTLSLAMGVLEVSYRDETGRSVEPGLRRSYSFFSRPERNSLLSGLALSLQGLFRRPHLVSALAFPEELDELLRSGYVEFEDWRDHGLPNKTYERVPWLLPVFVVPPQGLEDYPWEQWIQEAVLGRLGVGHRCVAVRQLTLPEPLPALTLPLWVHDSRPDVGSVREVRARGWHTEHVANHALLLTDEADYAEQHPKWRPDVLVQYGDRDRQSVSSHGRRLTVRMSDAGSKSSLYKIAEPVLRITTWPYRSKAELDPIVNLVYGLIHDYALHELLWILRKTQPGYDFELACDARSNQALRLSTAMSDLRTEHMSALAYGGRLYQSGMEREVAQAVDYLVSDFSQERRGLTAIARSIAFMRELESRAREPTLKHGRDGSPDGRRVEMMLEQYDAFGVASPLDKDRLRAPLRAGWRYRLGVQIGLAQQRFSLLDKPPPDIDTAVGWDAVKDEALQLEVCVFAKDFTLLSPSTQTLQLHRSGGPTRLVHFELKAPPDKGTHDLRVAIFVRNNLVQSFQLTAEVAGPEQWYLRRWNGEVGGPGVSVRLTSSAVRELTAASEFRERALSVALNDDARPAGHTLMIKGSVQGVSTRTDEVKIRKINERYRAVLAGAHNGELDSAMTVWRMALLGRDLWNWLAGAAGGEGMLRGVRREGKTLQFVRHSSVLGMPWHLVYDFDLPTLAKGEQPQICRSDTPVIADWPELGAPGCRHCLGQRVICVEGFWAFRHILELISEEAPISREESNGKAPSRAGAVDAGVQPPLLTFGGSLGFDLERDAEAAWRAVYPGRFHRITETDAPVHSNLWNATLRPAVLLLLSHLYEADDDAGLEKRVYACSPAELKSHEISVTHLNTAKVRFSPWEAPRPVVLLMACESARQDTHELVTLTDAFLQSGAAAVVGTEWTVHAGEALAFGAQAAESLLDRDASLGEVMQAYYRRALASGDSVPMLFTAYGNADLKIKYSTAKRRAEA